jgi:signal transduction histidine kinase
VSLAEEGPSVRVDVRDNGIGVSREHQAVIFEKFRQVGDTLTRKPAGTGLGLAICRQIIARLGGRLWLESEPGRGSVFSFSLPAALADEAPSPMAASA